jgi:hypothetical protein
VLLAGASEINGSIANVVPAASATKLRKEQQRTAAPITLLALPPAAIVIESMVRTAGLKSRTQTCRKIERVKP